MPPEKKIVLKVGEVAVPAATLQQILEKQATMEKDLADRDAKMAGLEELFAAEAGKKDEPGLRERKDYEPKFRTVFLRKYDPANSGDPEKEDFVVGWSPRGAYKKAVDNGLGGKEVVEFLDVIFLNGKKDGDKIEAVSVPALSVVNDGRRVACKVLDIKDYKGRSFKPTYPATGQAGRKVATGEKVQVTTWDPRHGLVTTGEEIDGWVEFSDLTFVVQIPGRAEPFEIDQRFVNM